MQSCEHRFMRFAYAWGLLLVCPVSAAAHIHLTTPQSRTDMLTGDQKEEHCGVATQTRTTRVTTYKPGETIMVSWMETINHTGWFRIAFQPAGQVFEIPPASNGPDGTGAASNYPTEDLTGMTDAPTASIILADRIADGTLMKEVTLPNMECSNCTLQFIQVMTDKPPYTADAASDDIYFNCADITLSNAPPMVDAGIDTPDAPGANASSTSGGCATSDASLGAAFALLGVAIRRRKRA